MSKVYELTEPEILQTKEALKRYKSELEILKKEGAYKMVIYNVIDTLPIGNNTSVLIDGDGKYFKNGVGILDENGKPYEVLTVAMSSGRNIDDLLNKTSLLVKGKFSSKKLFV
jgi:hypothetical protein